MLPSIQQQLKEFFPQAELLSSIPPDQVIAIGASKQVSDDSATEVKVMKPKSSINAEIHILTCKLSFQAAILSGLDDVLIQKNSEEMNLQCLPVDLLLKVCP